MSYSVSTFTFVPPVAFFPLPLSYGFSPPPDCPALSDASSHILGGTPNCRSCAWSCRNPPAWNYFTHRQTFDFTIPEFSRSSSLNFITRLRTRYIKFTKNQHLTIPNINSYVLKFNADMSKRGTAILYKLRQIVFILRYICTFIVAVNEFWPSFFSSFIPRRASIVLTKSMYSTYCTYTSKNMPSS